MLPGQVNVRFISPPPVITSLSVTAPAYPKPNPNNKPNLNPNPNLNAEQSFNGGRGALKQTFTASRKKTGMD